MILRGLDASSILMDLIWALLCISQSVGILQVLSCVFFLCQLHIFVAFVSHVRRVRAFMRGAQKVSAVHTHVVLSFG